MNNSEKLISAYDKSIGRRSFRNAAAFERFVRQRHGRTKTDEIYEAINNRGGGNLVDIYPLLYESLSLSMDFLNFGDDLLRNYLLWFLDLELPPPPNVLDIACGNGYLTCFYARIFPQSQILGIDNSLEAVNCATELAGKLGLKNVQFAKLDFNEASSDLPMAGFDLITAVTAFNEILEFPNIPRFLPASKLIEAYKREPSHSSINEIATLLTPEVGVFVSLEKWSDLRGYGWWASSLQNAGLPIDFGLSKGVSINTLRGESQRVPALLCRNISGLPNSVEDTIAFWLYAAYQKPFSKLRTFDFQSDLAEAAFLAINPKTFKSGAKAEYNEFTIRLEIWQSGPFVILFEFDGEGSRTLEVLPSIFLSDVVTRQEDRIRELSAQAKVTPEYYDAPEVFWSEDVQLGPQWLMS
jgi:SAM-dependent methyltransferase